MEGEEGGEGEGAGVELLLEMVSCCVVLCCLVVWCVGGDWSLIVLEARDHLRCFGANIRIRSFCAGKAGCFQEAVRIAWTGLPCELQSARYSSILVSVTQVRIKPHRAETAASKMCRTTYWESLHCGHSWYCPLLSIIPEMAKDSLTNTSRFPKGSSSSDPANAAATCSIAPTSPQNNPTDRQTCRTATGTLRRRTRVRAAATRGTTCGRAGCVGLPEWG